MNITHQWMNLALEQARLALDENEVPVGAVVVMNGRLIGRGYNRTRSLCDPTAHAEILAITAACQSVGQSRLEGAELYVTLEPCAMCAGAIVLARIKCLYYGTCDPKTGACGSVFDITREPRLNHQVEVHAGIATDQASRLLVQFFDQKRNEKRKNNKKFKD